MSVAVPLEREVPAAVELPDSAKSMLLLATLLVLGGVLATALLFWMSDSSQAPNETIGLLASAMTLAALGILAGWRAWHTWSLNHRAVVTASERLSAFHAAMSAVNRLVLRRPEPAALFEGVCEICVNRAGARRAFINLAGRGETLHASAARGEPDGVKGASDVNPSSDRTPLHLALLAFAIRSREPVLVNDTMKDGKTKVWRDYCAKHGVLALVAIPLKRAGTSVGMLLLCADTKDFFGEAVIPLLSELGADVSFALENSDKEHASHEALQEKMRGDAASSAKTDFLGHMSHELRTPLNAMLGFTQLLATDCFPVLAPRHAEWVRLINEAGWHLLGMVDDLMDISGIESGRAEVANAPCAIAPLVREAIALSQPLALTHEVSLRELAPFPADIGAMVDPKRLRQVLINLLSNACKYNRPHGTVTVKMSSGLDEVIIDVVDNGRGMTAEQIAHLFQPFNRLGKERLPIEGTGIGLALSRQLVESMHGRLEFEGSPESGVRARLSIPACDLPATAEGARNRAGVVALEPLRHPAVVLCIDDDEVNRLVVEAMLSRIEGVSVLVAATGCVGLSMAAQSHPDLVLLDMQLPDLSGTEVLAALRADPATASLKVVSVSANSLPSDVTRAKLGGAIDYWSKPLDLESFCRRVTLLLNDRKGERTPVAAGALPVWLPLPKTTRLH
ncbi:MAG: ATP-binding protein [Caldimonas sp.]